MSELTCAEFVELVTAYLERDLPAEVEARFVEHLGTCEGCERYLEQFRDTIRRLGSLPPESLPASVRQQLLTAFREWPRAEGNTNQHDSSQEP